jgi:hypothetical protein
MMRLPNSESAIVPIEKLRDYCLSPEHATGRNKARVFRSAMGLEQGDAHRLELLIRSALEVAPATRRGTTALGEEFWVVKSMVPCACGPMRLVTAWAIGPGRAPRLLSCYLKELKQ